MSFLHPIFETVLPYPSIHWLIIWRASSTRFHIPNVKYVTLIIATLKIVASYTYNAGLYKAFMPSSYRMDQQMFLFNIRFGPCLTFSCSIFQAGCWKVQYWGNMWIWCAVLFNWGLICILYLCLCDTKYEYDVMCSLIGGWHLSFNIYTKWLYDVSIACIYLC